MHQRLTRRAFIFLGCGAFLSRPTWAGQRTISVQDFLKQLRLQVTPLYGCTELRHEFEALAGKYSLPRQEGDVRRYIRLRTLFESTRDAGLWHVQWQITDQEPSSKLIWKQWKEAHPGARVTSIAECHELSALVAFLARRLDVPGVGLFWPRANHTVAVWMPNSTVRIVLPTSQIFLTTQDTLGTLRFNPFLQKTIYPYMGNDITGEFHIPLWLAKFFLLQIESYGQGSQRLLQSLRNRRSEWFEGRVSRPLGGSWTEADTKILQRFYRHYSG